jgi:hypothetical protein
MKKYILLLSFVFIIACGKHKTNQSDSINESTESQLTEFVFQVDNLADSLVSDSIWKMIFTTKGIEQMVIIKEDSLVTFNVDSGLISRFAIQEEIIRRGGELQ